MTVFLTNGFSPSMIRLHLHDKVNVEFEEINDKEFCEILKDNNNVTNAIGHASTVNLINALCSTQFGMNRISIVANKGDVILSIILSIRLEEGKVLNNTEITQLLSEGKIKFVKVSVL